jgi:AraC family transcriptional regulator
MVHRGGISGRDQLVAGIGAEVVRFQEESRAFDDVAARILALEPGDLPCMTLLLFGGPSSIDQLAGALGARKASVSATVERLQLAGYAHDRPGGGAGRIELTQHAREWIDHIWAPLRDGGTRLLAAYSGRDLALMYAFMRRAREVQERQARQLRRWLEAPGSAARQAHLRGGLSPAALRRVQVFVEANLGRVIRLADLASRAGLSVHHFARAFRRSVRVTPRQFLEQRRVERARRLILDSRHPLAEVAVECGFGTQSRLTTAFKRQMGSTPARYRRGAARLDQVRVSVLIAGRGGKP